MEAIDQVDGWLVNHVDAGQDQSVTTVYRRVGIRDWIQEDPHGGPATAHYREVNRDDWSVYLEDPSRDLQVQVDLHTRRVTTQVGQAAPTTTHRVVRAAAVATALVASRVEARTDDECVAVFRQVGATRWAQEGPDGGPAQATFDEQRRDDWSIHLADHTRSLELRLDLHTREVLQRVQGGDETVLYGLGAVDIAARASDPGDVDATITFHNDTSVVGEVLWVDFLGNEVARGMVQPGHTFRARTFIGHIWVVRDQASRRRLRTWRASVPAVDVPVQSDELRSIGGPPVDVAIKNLSTRPVALRWRDPTGEPSSLSRLGPAEVVTLAARAGDVLDYIVDDQPVGVVLLGMEQRQFRTIDRVPGRRPTATLHFHNTTPVTIGVFLHAEDERIRFHRLAPGEVARQPVVPGETWTARELATRQVVQVLQAPADDQAVVLMTAALRSRRGKEAVTVDLVNTTALAGRVLWVDPDGIEHQRGQLDPNGRLQVDGRRGDVWRVREATTRKEIGLHVAGKRPASRHPVRVRSTHSRAPATLTIRNRTLLTVDVLWVDGTGEEREQGLLGPWGQRTFSTHLTHAWVVRERESREVLDFTVVQAADDTVEVDAFDLRRRESEDRVAAEFHNVAGFAVDVVELADVGGEALVRIQPDDSATVEGPAGRSYGFREPVSRSVFSTFTSTGAPDQFHQVQLAGEEVGGPTSLTWFNPTPVEVDLFTFDTAGEHHVGGLEAWQTALHPTRPGVVWLARERRTGAVLACTRATTTPRTVRLDLQRLVPTTRDTPVTLTVRNRSGLPVEPVTVEPDGSTHPLARLEDGGEAVVASYASHVIRMTAPDTGELVDVVITGEVERDVVVVDNNLVTDAIPAGGLRTGEVALFPDESFVGTPVVTHSAIHDLAAVGAVDVSSLRLGPSTGITAYRDPGLQGPSDVFHIDATTLHDRDVGVGFRSFEVFTVAPPREHVTRVSSDLVTGHRIDADGAIESFPAYQTVLTFPPEVTAIMVGATDELTVVHRGLTTTVDPDSWVTLTPNGGGSLMLTTPATGIGSPALMVRTNAMRAGERFLVFPDAALMDRIADLPEDAIWNAPGLALRPGVREDQEHGRAACAQVQAAIQQLAKAVPAESVVGARPRVAEAGRMDFDAWTLGLAGEPNFAPLSPDQAAQVPVGEADVSLFFLGIKPIRLDIRPIDLGHELAKLQTTLDRAGRGVDRTLREIDDTWVKPALKTLEDEVLEPLGDAVDEGLEDLADAVDDAGTFLDATFDAALEDALDLVVDVGVAVTGRSEDDVRTVVLDTVAKVGEVIETVVDTIVETVDSVLEFLESVLDWDSIKDTQRLVVDLAEQVLDQAPRYVEAARSQVHDLVGGIRGDIPDLLAKLGQQLGAIPPPDAQGDADGTTAGTGMGLDQFLTPIMDFLDGDTAGHPEAGEPDEQAALDRARTALDTVGAALDDLLADVGSTVGAGVGGILKSPPDQIVPRIAGLMLAVVEDVATGMLDITESVADVLFDLLLALLDGLRTLLTTPLPPIPIVSELYLDAFGVRPTQLGLMAFLVAVPASIMGRATVGEAWPPSSVQLDQALSDTLATTFSIVDVALHHVRLPLDTMAIMAGDLVPPGLADWLLAFDGFTMLLDMPGYRVWPNVIAGVDSGLTLGEWQLIIIGFILGGIGFAWKFLKRRWGRQDPSSDLKPVDGLALCFDLAGHFFSAIASLFVALRRRGTSDWLGLGTSCSLFVFDVAGMFGMAEQKEKEALGTVMGHMAYNGTVVASMVT